MRPGDRFGRLTVLVINGRNVHCICDCGTKKDVAKYHLQRLNTKSCGCLLKEVSRELAYVLMDSETNRQKMAEAMKRRHAEGYYEQANRENIRRAIEARTGPDTGTGLCAKGEGNHIAKHWRIRSPDGFLVEGKSLRNLVRENASLFDQKDVEFRKNEHGTDLWCRADMGLRALFRKTKPCHSWKGWTRA